MLIIFQICNKAIRDEVTSHHYLPNKRFDEASNILTRNIIFQSNKTNTEYIVVTSWTIYAHYIETID